MHRHWFLHQNYYILWILEIGIKFNVLEYDYLKQKANDLILPSTFKMNRLFCINLKKCEMEDDLHDLQLF